MFHKKKFVSKALYDTMKRTIDHYEPLNATENTMELGKQDKKKNPKLSFHLMKFAVQDFKKNSNNLTEDEYNQVLQNANEEMLLHQLILNSEEACCVVIPEPIFQRTLQAVIAEYQSDELFYEMLDANCLTYPQYVTALHNDLRVETIIGKVASAEQTVTTSEMMRYYKSHYSSFNHPERRSVSIIQITAAPSAGFDPAFSTINNVHERLSNHPDDFALEAQTYSECDTGKDGGNLGVLVAGELCNELNTALFSLDKGEISQVIENTNAYYILRCNAIYPALHIPFEKAIAQIRPQLLKKKQLSACRLWLQKIVQGTEKG